MASKKKLLVEDNYDFFLFGINCPEKSYRLCFALNSKLKASFAKSIDLEVWASIPLGQDQDQRVQWKFPVFSFRNEDMFTDYHMIVNRIENKFLAPEFKQADYLLMVQGGIPNTEKGSILKKLKEIIFVQTAFELDPKKMKSKENLFFK